MNNFKHSSLDRLNSIQHQNNSLRNKTAVFTKRKKKLKRKSKKRKNKKSNSKSKNKKDEKVDEVKEPQSEIIILKPVRMKLDPPTVPIHVTTPIDPTKVSVALRERTHRWRNKNDNISEIITSKLK
jgi:hypothetical protein